MNILGINAYHGDVSAVLLINGQLVAAVEEERFRRIKHWAGFPRQAIEHCLELGAISPEEVDAVAISRRPNANLLRKASFALRRHPNIRLIRDRFANRKKLGRIDAELAETLHSTSANLHYIEHHPAHLASAFFVSHFEEAAVCAIDGFGDFVSTSFALGKTNKLQILDRIFFPHSLGILYLAITQYLGFWKYGDEYKVMGLAPYGSPDYVGRIRQLLHLKKNGGFELNLRYFRHWSEGADMTWEDGEPRMGPVFTPCMEELLGPARQPDEPVEAHHEAIAASVQRVFEEAVFHILNAFYDRTRQKKLCLAGGCAMNSVANGKIRMHTPFEEVYIQPAAGDNGTALGAACYVWHHKMGNPRNFTMDHAYWGQQFSTEEIAQAVRDRQDELHRLQVRIQEIESPENLCQEVAHEIAEGRVVGWFQGRMEWGARALGNRSIVADPRREDMRDLINTKIKFRERFRPFAPSILESALDDYFVHAVPDPFMIQVYPVREDKRSRIPAVTHVDGSGRLQTVNQQTNPLYWRLIRCFEEQTGVPILLNTSFNENEPIVNRPEEALDCFIRTNMDVLSMGSLLLKRPR